MSRGEASGRDRSAAKGDSSAGERSRSKVQWKAALFRAVGRPVFRILFHVLSRVEIEGLGNVPTRDGYLVACNHVSIYEPPLVLAFWPTVLEVAAAADVFDRPQQGTLVRMYGSLPVHRGAFDRRLIEAMVAMLKAGRGVLIFPEGGRTHSPGLRQAWHGTSYVAAKAGVDVIPVGVVGTESLAQAIRSHHRTRLRMIIGEPVSTPSIDLRSPDRKRALLSHSETIMRSIASLLPETYRGVYR